MDTKQAWKKQWNTWVRPTKLPGLWQRKEGGFLVRARVTDATTGHLVEIRKVLPEATEAVAFAWLSAERTRIKSGVLSDGPPKMRFAEFAQRLYERKLAALEIRSARGREKWSKTLEHLIAGTRGRKTGRVATGFGEIFVDHIGVKHVGVEGRDRSSSAARTTHPRRTTACSRRCGSRACRPCPARPL